MMDFLNWYADHYILGTIVVIVGGQVIINCVSAIAGAFKR